MDGKRHKWLCLLGHLTFRAESRTELHGRLAITLAQLVKNLSLVLSAQPTAQK